MRIKGYAIGNRAMSGLLLNMSDRMKNGKGRNDMSQQVLIVNWSSSSFGTHGKFGYIPDPPEIDCEGEVIEDFDMEDCRRCCNYDDCLKEYRAYMERTDNETEV